MGGGTVGRVALPRDRRPPRRTMGGGTVGGIAMGGIAVGRVALPRDRQNAIPRLFPRHQAAQV